MKALSLTLTLLVTIAIGMMTLSQPARAQERELAEGATVGVVSTAIVKAVDPDTRTVTLETADGATRTIRCSREAINFDQVQVGDQVKAVAMERYAVAFGKDRAARAPDGLTITRAPKGARPGLIIANTEDVAAKIDSVDPANQMITLQAADGQRQSYRLLADADLSGVKPGDQVTVQVTTGLALWVEKPQDAQPAAGTIKPGEAIAAIGGASATFTVEAIDPQKRIVTLKNTEGETRKIHLGKEAIDFDQIQVGDKVKATLAEEVAIAISKGGAPPMAREGALVARAPRGSKPGVIIAESVQVTAQVQSIDADARTITLVGPEGKSKTVKVGPKVDLSQLKSGDDVTARVTAALAIVVEKP